MLFKGKKDKSENISSFNCVPDGLKEQTEKGIRLMPSSYQRKLQVLLLQLDNEGWRLLITARKDKMRNCFPNQRPVCTHSYSCHGSNTIHPSSEPTEEPVLGSCATSYRLPVCCWVTHSQRDNLDTPTNLKSMLLNCEGKPEHPEQTHT